MNRTMIMLSRTALAVGLLLAGALIAAAAEPDLSGVWTLTMEGDLMGGSVDMGEHGTTSWRAIRGE